MLSSESRWWQVKKYAKDGKAYTAKEFQDYYKET